MALAWGTVRGWGQGWVTWLALMGVAWCLPGRVWRAPQPGAFPWRMALVWLGCVAVMVALIRQGVIWGGPRLARSRPLLLLESVPMVICAAAMYALWPAQWGPPGVLAWCLGFLVAALPSEMRWVAQALPAEQPFPAVYGAAYALRVRRRAVDRVLSAWVLARWPVWMMGTLVLEKMLGLRGMGSDWADRLAQRQREGVLAWMVVLACLWTLGRMRDRRWG